MGTDEARDAWTSLVLLERFRGGDELAAEALFARYFERLTSLARSRLSTRLARRTDPEDIVLSVYRSFFVEAREGRYTLGRGGDLWRLLASITRHKLLRQVRHQSAARRSFDVEVPLDQVDEGRCVRGARSDPTPEEALALADELERVFSLLDPFGRRVLELRLQGLQISEIAEDAGRSERSVRRSLAQIRDLLAGSARRCLTRNSNRASSASSRPGAFTARARSRTTWGDPFERASPGRYRLLVELICIDLEFRWRRSRRRRGRPRWETTSSDSRS